MSQVEMEEKISYDFLITENLTITVRKITRLYDETNNKGVAITYHRYNIRPFNEDGTERKVEDDELPKVKDIVKLIYKWKPPTPTPEPNEPENSSKDS